MDRKRGITWLEVLVIVAVLAAVGVMLYPMLTPHRGNSPALRCVNNQRQIATAFINYVAEHRETFLPADGWATTIRADPSNLVCRPSPKVKKGYTYNATLDGKTLGQVVEGREATSIPLIADGENAARPGVWDSVGQADRTRHGELCVVAFIDGHVEMLRPGDALALEGKANGKDGG